MNETSPDIAGLYEVMQNMQKHAAGNDWEKVDFCDHKRKAILDSFDSRQPLTVAEQETVRQILQLDQEILEMVRVKRQKAASALRDLSKQQSGANAYQQNQSAY